MVTTLSARHLRIDASETVLGDEAQARDEFAETCALVCRDALDLQVAERLAKTCANGTFLSDHVRGLGHRLIERPPLAGTMISLLLHREPLFRWLERVTGCESIRAVEGRVVQTHAVGGDELKWHDDMGGDTERRLGVTMAIASPPYEGGLFELRPVGGDTLLRFKHDSAGTMLIFKVSSEIEHCVHPLTSGGPRQVFTGWFIG